MATVMAAPSPILPQPGSSKRPRLSLQTNISLNLARSRGAPFTISSSPAQSFYTTNHTTASNYYGSTVLPSPTKTNTISNIHVPSSSGLRSSTPLTAINTRVSKLRLNTSAGSPAPAPASTPTPTSKRVKLSLKTPTSHVSSLPETPLTAHPISPEEEGEKKTVQQPGRHLLPVPFSHSASTMSTPPLSAESSDVEETKNFKFGFESGVAMSANTGVASEPRSRRRGSYSATGAAAKAPYTHPRTLRSILRNSPLPSDSRLTPSPRPRQASFDSPDDDKPKARRPAKRVCYNTPLTQTIVNNKYTVSHIDLLIADEDASSECSSEESTGMMAYTADETRDGGSTPGPFEDVQRRMACLATSGSMSPRPTSGGLRKRKRKEKTRRWVWTIGVEDEEEEDETKIGGAIAALRAMEKMDEVDTPVVTTPPSLEAYLEPSSPTPTPSMTSSTTAEDDDDDVGSMDLDGDAFDMDLDTPRASISACAPTFFSGSSVAPPRPTLSLILPDPSRLCPGNWHQPLSPLRTHDIFFSDE